MVGKMDSLNEIDPGNVRTFGCRPYLTAGPFYCKIEKEDFRAGRVIACVRYGGQMARSQVAVGNCTYEKHEANLRWLKTNQRRRAQTARFQLPQIWLTTFAFTRKVGSLDNSDKLEYILQC
jgi:hypothetical protein